MASSLLISCRVGAAITLILLSSVVVVNLLSDPLALAQVSGQVLLLLFIVMPEQLLPVVGVHILLLLDDLSLNLLNLKGQQE